MIRLWRYAKTFQPSMVLATIYSLLNKLFDIAPELLIGVLVDTVIHKESSWVAKVGIIDVHQQLLVLAGLTVVIWALESLFQYLYSVRWRNIAQGVQHGLRVDLYAHVQKLEMRFFEQRSSGDILTVLNEDVNQLERFLNEGVNDLIQVSFSSLAVGAIFFYLTPAVAGVALLPVPLILVGAFYFQKRLAHRYLDVREKASTLTSLINNNLAGISTIKAFVGQSHEQARVAQSSADYQQANVDTIRVASAITPVIRMAVLIGFVATLYVGGAKTLAGELEVGAYSVLVFLTQRLLWPLTRLANMTDLYQRSSASAKRALDLLQTPTATRPATQEWFEAPVQGELCFKGVELRYGDFWALRGVNLHIPAGTSCALVGSTGSGKSSLLKLLLGFYAPSQGRILLDGVDTQTLELDQLRRSIGFVNQDPFLTQGDIASNIAYGSFDADASQIKAAADAAEATGFIDNMPRGMASPVGERGQRLSGGQRQRIAIARALVKEPPILVLDEATSAVDNETEAAIQRSLRKVTKARTTVMVAHRLSTIRFADQICVMEQGRIVERGSHEALLEQRGRYHELWRLQTGEMA